MISGEVSFTTPSGVKHVKAGQFAVGGSPGKPMQATNTGSTASHTLALFVLDAGKPFSAPAKF